MSRGAKKKPSEMNFLDHLEELRGALWRAFAGVFLAAAVCYYFAPILQSLLLIPFEDQSGSSLALLAPTEGFIVRLKISLVAGLVATAPWVFYQLWSFTAPGLFSHERKLVLPVVFFSSLLFLIGAGFSMYVLPHATSFFLGFSTQDIQNAWSLGKYVDFVLRLLLAFGIVFELPLVIYFLARFGIVTPPFLRKYRRHMIIGFLVLSALITPPDVFTQAILTLPMIVLYEVSILLAIIAEKQYRRKHEEFMSDEGDEPSGESEDDEDYSDFEDTVGDVPREVPSELMEENDTEVPEEEASAPTIEDIRDERLRKLSEEQTTLNFESEDNTDKPDQES